MTTLIRGKMARFTLVDRCGTPLVGPYSTLITSGLISVAMTPTTNDGTPIQVDNANGDRCVDDVPTPKFSYWTLAIALCGVNPWLVHFLTGQDTWDGVTEGVPTGFTIGDDVDVETLRFAMELWSGTSDDICDDEGDVGYGYFLLPKIAKGQVGDHTWQNDAINFTINGAVTKGGNDWGVGPYDDVAIDSDEELSPLLRPLGTRKHYLSDIVYAPPPAASADPIPLGSKATTATAGIPGTHSPSDSWMPTTLAGMADIEASPETAWTTGQYVTLFDGTTQVSWNGTAWEAGAA